MAPSSGSFRRLTFDRLPLSYIFISGVSFAVRKDKGKKKGKYSEDEEDDEEESNEEDEKEKTKQKDKRKEKTKDKKNVSLMRNLVA